MPLLGACLDLRHYCLEAEGAQPHLAGGCWLPCVSQVVLESHDPLRHRITHGENQSYLSALWNGQRSVKPRSRQFFEQKRGACLSCLMGKGGSRDGSRDSSRASVLPALCPLTRQGRAVLQVRMLRATHRVPWLWELRPIRENKRRIVLKLQDRLADP